MLAKKERQTVKATCVCHKAGIPESRHIFPEKQEMLDGKDLLFFIL